jgi:hypothetical protein
MKTKKEIREKREVVEKETDQAWEKTEYTKEQGDKAKAVYDAQREPSLNETAAQLNEIAKGLGSTIKTEVETKAKIVDDRINKMTEYEEELSDQAESEKEAAETIKDGLSGVDNEALKGNLKQSAETRIEAEGYYKGEKSGLEAARTEDSNQLKSTRDRTQQIANSIRQF